MTDISDKVAQRERLSSIFTTVTEGVVLIGHDGRPIEWNASAERILCLTANQMHG